LLLLLRQTQLKKAKPNQIRSFIYTHSVKDVKFRISECVVRLKSRDLYK